MAHIRKHPKSGRWQVRYRDPAGRERSKTFKRKTDADHFAATVTADVLRGEFIDHQLGKTTVGELADRWQQTRRHLAQATQDQDRHLLGSSVLPVFGTRSVASVRPSEIAGWLAGLTVAPATKTKALQKLSAVMAMAVADGAIRSNPCDPVPRPSQRPQREGRALSDVEMAAILAAADEVDESTAAMVWVMGRAGLRIGEAIALRRRDVDLAAGVLHVVGSMSRSEGLRRVKGREGARSIPMSPDLVARVRRHVSEQSVAALEGWLFTAPRGGRVRYDNWRTRVWDRVVEVAGIGDVNPHDLRHSCATRLFIVDRWGVPEVQSFMGHADPTVTLRVYTHIAAESLPAPSDGHFADTLQQ